MTHSTFKSTIGGKQMSDQDQVLIRSDLERFAHYAKKMWAAEPKDTPRVADKITARKERLKQLGNSVVPQIPQFIGNCILDLSLIHI